MRFPAPAHKVVSPSPLLPFRAVWPWGSQPFSESHSVPPRAGEDRGGVWLPTSRGHAPPASSHQVHRHRRPRDPAPFRAWRCLRVVCQPGPRWERTATQHCALFLSLVTWPGSWGVKGSRLSLQRRGPTLPAPRGGNGPLSSSVFLRELGGRGEAVPASRGPAMEEQGHRCGSTWESPPDKSHPDSPWSWVRAVRPLQAALPRRGVPMGPAGSLALREGVA